MFTSKLIRVYPFNSKNHIRKGQHIISHSSVRGLKLCLRPQDYVTRVPIRPASVARVTLIKRHLSVSRHLSVFNAKHTKVGDNFNLANDAIRPLAEADVSIIRKGNF